MGNGQVKADDEGNSTFSDWTAGEDIKEEDFEEKVIYGLPNHVFKIFERCVKHLPYRNMTDEDIVELSEKVERVVLLEPTDIIKKGDPTEGLYILIDGEASVMTEEADIVLFTINVGDFFGEISCLFGIPATARVRVQHGAVLLLLKKDHLTSFERDPDVTMMDWYIRRRYLATDRTVSAQPPWNITRDVLEKRMVKSALQAWPLFKDWSEEAIDSIIQSHPTGTLHAKVILYPAKSTITAAGDPDNDLIILIRGKAVVIDKTLGDKLDIQARKYPFVIGEEGLFCTRDHVLTVKAKTGCVVAHVSKEAILKAKDKNGDTAVWANATKRWQYVFNNRDQEIYSQYQTYLQTEVLYKMFREHPIFTPCPIGFTYLISSQAVGQRFTAKRECLSQVEYERRYCFLVLSGCCSLMSDGDAVVSYSPSQVFWRCAWMPKKGKVVAKTDCLLVKVPYSTIQEALKIYPETKIVEPSRPADNAVTIL